MIKIKQAIESYLNKRKQVQEVCKKCYCYNPVYKECARKECILEKK